MCKIARFRSLSGSAGLQLMRTRTVAKTGSCAPGAAPSVASGSVSSDLRRATRASSSQRAEAPGRRPLNQNNESQADAAAAAEDCEDAHAARIPGALTDALQTKIESSPPWRRRTAPTRRRPTRSRTD